jgi:hypothetical protein
LKSIEDLARERNPFSVEGMKTGFSLHLTVFAANGLIGVLNFFAEMKNVTLVQTCGSFFPYEHFIFTRGLQSGADSHRHRTDRHTASHPDTHAHTNSFADSANRTADSQKRRGRHRHDADDCQAFQSDLAH